MGLDGRLGDVELIGDLLVEKPSLSIISTRICWAVSVATRRAMSSVSLSVLAPGS